MGVRPLEGRVVLIAGAGRGVGRAVATQCAELGATLLVNDSGTARDGEGADSSVIEAAVSELGAQCDVVGDARDATTPNPGSVQIMVASSETVMVPATSKPPLSSHGFTETSCSGPPPSTV